MWVVMARSERQRWHCTCVVELLELWMGTSWKWKGKVVAHDIFPGSGHILWTTRVQYSQEVYKDQGSAEDANELHTSPSHGSVTSISYWAYNSDTNTPYPPGTLILCIRNKRVPDG